MLAARPFLIATLLVAAAAAAGTPAVAANSDAKLVSPALCQPYAPDTTAAELQVTQNGIYNPGTTIEKVICALPRDDEVKYGSETGLTVFVYYRGLGATAGRLVCTLFVGSTSMHSDPLVSASVAGPLVGSGARTYLPVGVGIQPATYIQVPNNLICAISPKVSMGAIFLIENGPTDVVEPS